MSIARFLSTGNMARMQKDFNFLTATILPKYYGEIALELRDNYFNLYHRGNSLSRVDFLANGNYRVTIASSFYLGSVVSVYVSTTSIPCKLAKGNAVFEITLTSKQLHPFFQLKHINNLCQQIKKRNFGEELTFEQMVITANMHRDDLVIIDRQITDTLHPGQMDLLLLRHHLGNQYSFQIIEGKLGNNLELSHEVAQQLDNYRNHLDLHFYDYKACYEENYRQKFQLGLIDNALYLPTIDIIKPVESMVIVIGYPGLAKQQVTMLKSHFPLIQVHPFYLELP